MHQCHGLLKRVRGYLVLIFKYIIITGEFQYIVREDGHA